MRKSYKGEKKMVLASNEEKIKEWEYGSVRVGGVETVSTLTVTNKRIIKSERSPRKVDQQEIPLDCVKGVHCRHDVPSKIGAFIMIALGIILALVGVVLIIDQGEWALISLVILGALFIYIGYNMLNQGLFTLIITTSGCEGTPLTAGFARIVSAKAPRLGKVKIKINNYVIDDIVDNLGAIIVEYRK